MKNLLLSIAKKIKLINVLEIVTILAIVSTIVLLKQLSLTRNKLAAQQDAYNQNAAAYEQLINQKADSIQNLAVMIKDLNAGYTDLKHQYVTIQQSTKLQIDSLRAAGNATATTITDTTSNKYVEVSFSGKQGIFQYSGFTRYYLPPSILSPMYSLTGSFLPIQLSNEVYYDNTDKLLKVKTVSLTPEIKLTASTIVDSSVYQNLRGGITKAEQTKASIFPSFGLLLRANLGFGQTNPKLSNNQIAGLSLDASVMAYYKYFNITYYPFTGYLSAGVFYNFDAGAALNKIF